MATAAADLLAAVIESHDTEAERRVFGAQFIEGATARLTPLPASAKASTKGLVLPVAIM
jgi:hypothetical protein